MEVKNFMACESQTCISVCESASACVGSVEGERERELPNLISYGKLELIKLCLIV